jgi:ribosomal protein S18 acetylase RimI-like enzyme
MSRPEPADLEVAEGVRSDIPSISTFILDAWMTAGPTAWGWSGATEDNVRALASADHLGKLLADPKFKVLLAREDGRIVGFAAVRELEPGRVELAGVIVDERHTGRGVGTALANKAMAVASSLGYGVMVVKTETYNRRALAFYESNGFTRTGVETEEVDGKTFSVAVLERGLGRLSGES